MYTHIHTHTYNTIQCNAIQYNTIHDNTIHYITLRYTTLHYITYICIDRNGETHAFPSVENLSVSCKLGSVRKWPI